MGNGIKLIDPAARRLSPPRLNWWWVGRMVMLMMSAAIVIYGLSWLWQLV